MTIAIGVLDHLIGQSVSLRLFYLIPIFVVALFAGSRPGVLIAVASAGVIYAIDFAQLGYRYFFGADLWNEAATLVIFLLAGRIGSSLKTALEREQALARTDYLTGAANRRAFVETTGNEISRARRFGRPFTVGYIDLDNFKTVNDHFGHSTGDRLLRLVAEVTRRNIRAVDMIARLGGDEFAILLTETEDDAARVVTDRIQSQLLEAMRQYSWPVTFSIGVASYVSPPKSVDEVLNKADELMYSVKRDGKNRAAYLAFGEGTHE
ncbi:MAG: sensor domain-containing diguanylate cyclase [Chloroflexi bacterium]|nr:sensor domain-containing diguanylate cyclase [Chloroflexota bacterium]